MIPAKVAWIPHWSYTSDFNTSQHRVGMVTKQSASFGACGVCGAERSVGNGPNENNNKINVEVKLPSPRFCSCRSSRRRERRLLGTPASPGLDGRCVRVCAGACGAPSDGDDNDDGGMCVCVCVRPARQRCSKRGVRRPWDRAPSIAAAVRKGGKGGGKGMRGGGGGMLSHR